jgi:hypothetical protein
MYKNDLRPTIFHAWARKLALISQLPQGLASKNSRETCGKWNSGCGRGGFPPAVAGRRTGRSGKENQIASATDQPRLPSVEPQPAPIAAGLPQPGCHAGAFARPMEPGNPADAQRGDKAVRPKPLLPVEPDSPEPEP